MDVIETVKQRQIQEGLSDNQFAKKLCISRHMWEAILKGKRQASWKVWSGIYNAYPDLLDPIIDLMDSKIRGRKDGNPTAKV